jgi:hypothetical protein
MKKARYTSKQGLLIASWLPMWTNGICGYVSLSLYDPAIGRAANMAKCLYRWEKCSLLGGILPASSCHCSRAVGWPHQPYIIWRADSGQFSRILAVYFVIDNSWTTLIVISSRREHGRNLKVDENVALPYEVMTRWVREIRELALEITYTQSRISLLHRRRVL